MVAAGETFSQRVEEAMIEIVKPDQLSDELLDAEVPCGGILRGEIARTCSRAAVLRTLGHGCSPQAPHWLKCVACWKVWYSYHSDVLRRQGFLKCRDCHRPFATIESFSDYRPL